MSMPDFELAEPRLETRLADKKPLYSEAEARTEANRCIYCVDAPCVQACPTGIDIPTFIHKIATGNTRGAARTIWSDNLLGYSCGRSCPVEVLCAGACVYNTWGREAIAIGRLQRFATETTMRRDPELLARSRKPPTGKKIALVGAGPASLAAAGHLALAGHGAVIFEKSSLPGGLNTFGIAPYKLYSRDALSEIEMLLRLGKIELRTGVEITDGEAGEGQVSASSLLEEYNAVFLGLGLGSDRRMGVPGDDAEGVVGATRLIDRIKTDSTLALGDIGRAVIVGGGNTAIDAARELAKLGVPEVTMVYRRTAADMSGYRHEMDGARREGVHLVERRRPASVEVEGGRATALLVTDGTDGAAPERIPADLIVVAIGQARMTGLAAAFPGVEVDPSGRVVVDPETQQTGNPKVYAGGDCVNGGKEVVNAAQHGKLAARAITAALA